jgi:Flp pilus assembly protein TadG
MGRRARTRRRNFHIVHAVKCAVEGAFVAWVSANGRRPLVQFLRDDSGSYLVYVTLLMPVMVGFAGLGTEAGLWLYTHQSLQGAADSAAVSAALDVDTSDTTGIRTQANAMSAAHGFVHGRDGVALSLNRPPQSGDFTTDPAAVEISLTRPQTRLLSGLWGSTPVDITARAVAIHTPGSCLLALNGTANGAISTAGGAIINVSGCGVFSDSNSNTSISATGGAIINALSVGAVGSVSQTGGQSSTRRRASPTMPLRSRIPMPMLRSLHTVPALHPSVTAARQS